MSTLYVRIKTMDNSELSLQITSTITVAELKNIIYDVTLSVQKLNIPQSNQRLIYKGKLLTPTDTISNYKIDNGDVIHLVANVQSDQVSNQIQAEEESGIFLHQIMKLQVREVYPE